MARELAPLRIYGYSVLYRKPNEKAWTADDDDEYRHLPAHYMSMDEALDRVEFLRTKAVQCRVLALVAEPTDTPEEFEENRIRE